MSHALSALDRVIIGILGVFLICGGVWATAFAFGLPLAHRLGDFYDSAKMEAFFASPWYPVALIVLVVALAVLAPWWIVANLRQHNFNRLSAGERHESGGITIATARVADTAAETLQSIEHVLKVRTTARMDRGRPTITWTISAAPYVSLAELTREVEQCERDVREALPGMDLDTRYLLQLRPVSTD